MKTWVISDTHLKHKEVGTYCQRPEGFTELINKNIHRLVKPGDFCIHVGDVGIDKTEGENGFMKYVREWPGNWMLVRGNHDKKSCQYYIEHGFKAACDAMIYRGVWITHKPSNFLPEGCNFNLHGHLHNRWDGFQAEGSVERLGEYVQQPWHRLFAVEYTNYEPVEFDKFIAKPDKYQARGPKPKKFSELRDQSIFYADLDIQELTDGKL